MKKIFILFGLIFLLTGCTGSYEINFGKTIDEEIIFTYDGDLYDFVKDIDKFYIPNDAFVPWDALDYLSTRYRVKEFDELDYIDDCKIIVKDDVIRIEDPGLRRVMISLRHANELNNLNYCFEEARYVCIDTKEKIDTGLYGTMWYVKENWDEPL